MIEFDYELDIEGFKLCVSVCATYEIDSFVYGADIDGNRGEKRQEIDNLDIKVFDSNGIDITVKMQNYYTRELFILKDEVIKRINDSLIE